MITFGLRIAKRIVFYPIMSSTELLRRLETRAVTAEKLIDTLKKEISDIKHSLAGHGHEKLKEENEKLRKEVEDWKNRLIQLEIANGKEQILLPPQTSSDKPLENSTVNVCSENSSQTVQKSAAPTKLGSKSSEVEGTAVNNDIKSQKKKKVTEGKKDKSASGAAVSEEPPIDVGRLDMRVGRIIEAKKHPDADALYVETVDVGEDKPRTVVSGLVKFVPLAEMQNRMAVLLCNLKPAKMRGVTSEAMVMCASSPEKVEILIPPEGSVPGDEIHVEGYPRVPDAVMNPKKKIFETVAPDLKTDLNKVATYKGAPFTVPGKGLVVAPSLTNVPVK